MNEITISVSGGVVQDVSGIPKGTLVKVLDYDIDGFPGEKLEKDGDGQDCFISEWLFPGEVKS